MTQADVQVEQVARAMTAKRAELLNKSLGLDASPGWDEYTNEGRADAMEEARAAILAYEATRPKVDELVEAARHALTVLDETADRQDTDEDAEPFLYAAHKLRAALQGAKP